MDKPTRRRSNCTSISFSIHQFRLCMSNQYQIIYCSSLILTCCRLDRPSYRIQKLGLLVSYLAAFYLVLNSIANNQGWMEACVESTWNSSWYFFWPFQGVQSFWHILDWFRGISKNFSHFQILQESPAAYKRKRHTARAAQPSWSWLGGGGRGCGR